MEKILVVGFTESAKGVIEQLRKREDYELYWSGEDQQFTPEDPDIEIIDVLNPTYPDNLQQVVDRFDPDLIFLCPGAERDLQDMIEGDTLERFLYREDLRIQDVPVIVISSEHHASP